MEHNVPEKLCDLGNAENLLGIFSCEPGILGTQSPNIFCDLGNVGNKPGMPLFVLGLLEVCLLISLGTVLHNQDLNKLYCEIDKYLNTNNIH